MPDYKTAMEILADWVISRKLIMDEKTKKITDKIRGNGKQTFREILKRHFLTSVIGGDSTTEIIKDKSQRLKNLMVRDVGTMKFIANSSGRIIKYEQVNQKQTGSKAIKTKTLRTWKPKEIWHTMNNPIADEIHGIPESESMQDLIKSLEQIQKTQAVTLHRYMKPTFFYEADTDDETELQNIANKIDKAIRNFNNVVLPKGTLSEIKQAKVAQFSILDPIPWMNFLSKKFVRITRIPDIIQGESRESATQAGELNYLGFKEYIIQKQRDFSEDIKLQLGLNIKFTEPIRITIEYIKNQETPKTKNKIK